MRIAMANDHAGFSLKMEIKQLLEAAGRTVVDFGTHDENPCDLPDFVYPAALAVGRARSSEASSSTGSGTAAR